jgi:hypothetical protein
MKTNKINLRLVKNIGNYESVHLEIEVQLSKGDNASDAFCFAKEELEESFIAISKSSNDTNKNSSDNSNNNHVDKKCLVRGTKEFNNVVSSILSGRATLEQAHQYYNISKRDALYLVEQLNNQK